MTSFTWSSFPLAAAPDEQIPDGPVRLSEIHQGTAASVRFMAEHAQYFTLDEQEVKDYQRPKLLRW